MASRLCAIALRCKPVGLHNGEWACLAITRRCASGRPARTPVANDADSTPLPFSTSGAARWRARDTFGGGAADDDVPWYQMPSVLTSVSALLLYFCVLREESDIDARLERDVLSQVPALERQSLEAYVAHQEAAGRGVDVERRRLEELCQQERLRKATDRAKS